MPINLYREMYNQAINISNLYRGGKFEFQSESDKKARLIKLVKDLKAQRRL